MNKFHKGRISVYSDRHKLIDSRIYYTSEGMKRIMSKWLQEFSGAEGFYIQVRVYDQDEHQKTRYRLPIPQVSEDVKHKLIRPPAIYDNGKSNYYS